MSRALLVLNSGYERQRASNWIAKAPDGTRVEFKGPKRTLPQNDRFWAMLTDVSTQLPWHGLKLSPDDWKLIFMDGLKREVRMAPNIDGTGFVNLGRSSSDLSTTEMSDLMELIASFGSSHGVAFHEPSASSPADDSGGVVTGSPPDAAAPHSGDVPPESSEQAPAAVTPSPVAGADFDKLRAFARQIVPVIGADTGPVSREAKALVSELGITDEATIGKARAITSAAMKACSLYDKPDALPLEDALELIAGLAGCEVRNLVEKRRVA